MAKTSGDSVRRIRIFVSSPSDVPKEREAAGIVVRRLGKDSAFRDHLSLDAILWDDPEAKATMLATRPPQDNVNELARPSDCHVLITILWSRMGTPLESPRKPDGTQYLSGTEWEYEDGCRDAEARGRRVLVYRCTRDPQVSLRDPSFAEKKSQFDLVDTFFSRFDGAERGMVGSYTKYASVEDFEKMLDQNLRAVLHEFVQQRRRATVQREKHHIETRPDGRSYYPKAQRQLIDETTRAFVGRRDIEDAFELFMARNPRGFFIVEGAPGDGKTALAAQVVKRRGSVHHFVSRTARRSQPELILCSLLEQLGASWSSVDPKKTRQASELSRLLEDALRTTASDGRPLVVVLDALNELDGDDIGCLFVPIEGLPSRVYFFVTSQPGERLDEWKSSLLDVPHETHRLPPLTSDEVRQLLDKRFPGLDEKVRSSIVGAARGNPLYVRAAMDAYERDANFDPAELPEGVEGYFRRAIRPVDSELLRHVLGLLAISRKPLSLEELSELTGNPQRLVDSQGILPVRQFLIEARAEYTFYHQQFHDFVVKTFVYGDELSRYHATIAEWLQRPSSVESKSDYRLLSLAHHLFYAGARDRLPECIDESFLLKKLHRFGYSVIEDIELIARSLLDAGDASVIDRCLSLVERLRSTMGDELIDDVAKRVQPNRFLAAAASHKTVRPQFGTIPGLDLHAVMLPKGRVTADFVEVVPLFDRLVIAIGDAPSSGIQSAFVARFLASVFRRLVETSRQLHLGQVLSELNRMISSRDDFPRVSMQCVELTPATGIVALANAGHPHPVFYSATRQKSDVVPIQGPRLHGSQITGAEWAYEQRHVEIAEGDVIVLMSDGLTEVGRLVDPYGYRFTAIVEKCAASDAKSICQAILDDWLTHPRDPQWIDDLSIVVIVVARRGRNARHGVD